MGLPFGVVSKSGNPPPKKKMKKEKRGFHVVSPLALLHSEKPTPRPPNALANPWQVPSLDFARLGVDVALAGLPEAIPAGRYQKLTAAVHQIKVHLEKYHWVSVPVEALLGLKLRTGAPKCNVKELVK